MTTLEEMELALVRLDAMPGILKRQVVEGTNAQVAEDMARYQEWRDDLDVEIALERMKQGTPRISASSAQFTRFLRRAGPVPDHRNDCTPPHTLHAVVHQERR
jgi:hypothetical protein